MAWWITQQLRMGNVKKRLAVVQKLALSDSADTVEPLVFALNDREPAVRIAAAEALGKFQIPQLAGLIGELLRDPLPEIRVLAATALGRAGDQTQAGLLVDLQQDQDPAVRQAANLALEQLGGSPGKAKTAVNTGGGSPVNSSTDPLESLVEALRFGAPADQIKAVRALERVEAKRAKTALVEALQKEDPAVLIEILGVLARPDDESVLKPLERLLNNNNPNVRSAAVTAVASCGQRQAVPALVRKLKDSFWEVRQAAVKALGRLGDPETVDAISALLSDKDRDVREGAVEALGNIGDRRALPHLVLALIDPESTLRSAASLALRRIDRNWEKSPAIRPVLPKLKQALTHGEYWVQHSASQLFVKLKVDPESVTDDDAPQKSADSGPTHPAFPVLADMLFDPDRDLRLAAVEAFRQLYERNAVPLLLNAAQDLDHNVQRAARQALAALE